VDARVRLGTSTHQQGLLDSTTVQQHQVESVEVVGQGRGGGRQESSVAPLAHSSARWCSLFSAACNSIVAHFPGAGAQRGRDGRAERRRLVLPVSPGGTPLPGCYGTCEPLAHSRPIEVVGSRRGVSLRQAGARACCCSDEMVLLHDSQDGLLPHNVCRHLRIKVWREGVR
jgi:hypothetical protein